MPPGIEVFRHVAAREVVVRNHGMNAVLYVVPGRSRRMDVTVSVEPGKLLYCWMDREWTYCEKWRLFDLKRGPD